MNVLLLLFTLFTIAMAQRSCCPYPSSRGAFSIEPSFFAFQCSEPVTMVCVLARVGSTLVATGIAPYNGTLEVDEKDLLVTGPFKATATFTCNTTSHLWNFGGAEFPSFECAFQKWGGSWSFGY